LPELFRTSDQETIMRIVIFGLTVSSSWGNGHATLWRSLIDGLEAGGHDVTFFERDVAYYRVNRDLSELRGRARLVLYDAWSAACDAAEAAIAEADAAIVTSYCPDGRAACELVLAARDAVRVFYDLDTPVTLARIAAGDEVAYIPVDGLAEFDLVLSFTGGLALDLLTDRLGARRVASLYGSVDPARHRPVAPDPGWSGACSYLGTWCDDRQATLDALFLAAARRRPADSFVIGGAQYPAHVSWPDNVRRFEHVPPASHPAFYCSSPLTVNITRAPMAELGYCPSGRLFEAAACGVPVLSDAWEGLATFFTPGDQILIARTTDEAVAALALPRAELARIGRRARERVLAEHAGTHRAAELVELIEGAAV
jgi:spore maturation protein CgeB